MAQNGTHHQNFVFEAGNEQRADRTVDQTCSQRLFFSRTRFTFEKAARNLTGGVVFFLVVHGQRKEILTGLLFASVGHVGHDRGFAEGRDHGAICLARNLTGFQCERFFAPLHCFRRYVEHLSYPKSERSQAYPGSPNCVAAPLPPTLMLSFFRVPGSGHIVSDSSAHT